VGDDEPSAVEDEMGHHAVDELCDPPGELRRLGPELVEGPGEAVSRGDVGTLEGSGELLLVVAGHGDGVARGDHAHDQAENRRSRGAAVDEVAEEQGPATVDVAGVGTVRVDPVAEPVEQLGQLVVAAVDVSDDVERAGVAPAVGPQRHTLDDRFVDLLDAVEDPAAVEALPA
jgi:hypothetical protein